MFMIEFNFFQFFFHLWPSGNHKITHHWSRAQYALNGCKVNDDNNNKNITTTAAHTCENMGNSSADTKEAVQVASSEDEVADH